MAKIVERTNRIVGTVRVNEKSLLDTITLIGSKIFQERRGIMNELAMRQDSEMKGESS